MIEFVNYNTITLECQAMTTKKLNCKEEILNIVMNPEVKRKIRVIAQLEGRSMTSEINRILQQYSEEYCTKNNIKELIPKTTEILRRSSAVF
jgi:hypothetical protein